MSGMDLILHIGTEKTGSTMLQKWLYSNRDALSGEGVFLSTAMGHPYQRKLVSYFVPRKDDFWMANGLRSQEERDAFYDGFIPEVEAELAAAGETHHTTVITSEHFHSRMFDPAEVAELAAFCQRNFASIKVVCYLRPQWKVRKSLYTTSLLNGGVRECDEFQQQIRAENPYYNYHAMYERWAAAFGAEAIDLRLFDAALFPDRDLRRDFLSTLSKPVDDSALSFDVDSANESLSQLMGDAFLTVNRTDPQRIDGRLNDRNILYKAALRKAETLDRGALEDTLSLTYAATFADSNAALAKAYFQRDTLFDAPEPPRDRTEATMTLEEVSGMIRDLVGAFVETTKGRLISKADAAQLRKIAQKAKGGTALDAADIDALLALAKPKKG